MKPFFRKSLLGVTGFMTGLILSSQAQARYETCYEQEYRCETRYEQVCRYEPVCHTVPGQPQCRQEQVCTPRPSQPSCQTVTECGVNAQGQKICKNRQVCNGHTGGGQSCGYVQKCDHGYAHQECRNEQRCYQEPRQNCGYQTVAKQCWVPDPPPYQPPYDPPTYPPGDDYGDNDGINYEVPAEIGPQTVTGLKLKILADGTAQVVFADEGQDRDFDTQYVLTVRDESGEIVLQDQVDSDGRLSQKIVLTERLSLYQDHTLKLKVIRMGGALDRKYTFVKTFFRPGAH